MKDVYKYAQIYPVRVCNLSCPRCFVRTCSTTYKDYGKMTWDEFTRICDSIKAQGIAPLTGLTFSGGEPTLWSYLTKALRYVKEEGITKHVRVGSNGIDRTEYHYDGADLVQLTDYGAINRADYYRLSRSKKFKVKQTKVIHLPWPETIDMDDSVLPAKCGCIFLAFERDKVYPCGNLSVQQVGGLDIDSNYYQEFVSGDPLNNYMCRRCLANMKIRLKYAVPPTFEWSIWESTFGGKFSLSWTNGKYLRYLKKWISHNVFGRKY